MVARKYKQPLSEFAQVSVAVFELYKFTKDPLFLRAGTSAWPRIYYSDAQKALTLFDQHSGKTSDAEKANMEMLDSRLLTLSAGLLAVSLTFISDLVDLNSANFIALLIAS